MQPVAKAKSPLLTIARTQRPMRKVAGADLATAPDLCSCSLNISGSDEEQARRVLEEYIQVRFYRQRATASSRRSRT
ncbi:hypothetical protein ACLK19_15765 [Escherichia coli]